MSDKCDNKGREHLQKKRKIATESKKSSTVKSQKLTNYFTVISTKNKSVTAVAVSSNYDEVNEPDQTVSTEGQVEFEAPENLSEQSEHVQITTITTPSSHQTDGTDSEVNNQNATTQNDDQIDCSLNLYRGYSLNIKKIQDKAGKETISVYHDKIGSRKRLLAKCKICSEFEEEAKKKSRHGIVYIAHGVRCDSNDKLKIIVDHLYSEMHKAAVDAKNYKELWDNHNYNHPWVRVLQNQEQVNLETLIKLAIDVYNDTKLLTPSAWSWPARALATAHAEQQISSLKENGLESPFIPI